MVRVAERLRVLGQPVRLRLVELLMDGPSTPQELSDALGQSQQNVSNAIYTQYAFATKLTAEARELPKVHVIAKNRLTQYVVAASAYSAVLRSIDADVKTLIARSSTWSTNFDRFRRGRRRSLSREINRRRGPGTL